ncbi:MAG: hypothetical protein JWM21_1239 [Acidobacteria bacterium]|nr:hypothetical protein [Acidobacteriota bacterium]
MDTQKILLDIARSLGGISWPKEDNLFILTFARDKVAINVETAQSADRLMFSCTSMIGYIAGSVDYRRLLLCNKSEDEELDLTWCSFAISGDPEGDLLVLTYTFLASATDLTLVRDNLSAVVTNMKKYGQLSRSLPGIVPLLR